MGIREGIETYMTSAVDVLPFAAHGFAWCVPAITFGLLGTLYYGFDKTVQ
jgi:branched-subunit amino acid permease